jgi:uncharacterized protein YggE
MRAVKSVGLATLLAFGSTSLSAQTIVNTAKGEVLLELQATGRITQKADIVEMSCTLKGSGVDKTGAQANLETRKAALATALQPLGIAASAISYPLPAEVPTYDVDAYDIDEALGAEAATGAAADAAAVAGAAAGGRKSRNVPRVTEIKLEQSAMVKIASLKQVQTVKETMTDVSCRGGDLVNFGITDPDGATMKAKDAAIVEARKQADHYAATLGLKVLRIARVGEYSPVSALMGPELSQMLMGYSAVMTNNIYNARTRDNLKLFGFGTGGGDDYVTFKTLWVDFVLAPK